jgi:hypothetical protein
MPNRPAPRNPRLLTAMAAAAMLVVGTACGSNVPHDNASGAPAAGTGTTGGGLSAPTGKTGGTTGGTGGTSIGGNVATSTGGSSTGGSSTGGSSTGGSSVGKLPTGHGGGGHLAAPPSVPGVTPTTIYIGSYYNKNSGSGNGALGLGSLDEGDARKPQNVMIDWVNSHGGVAGRRLAPIYYGFDASGTGPPIDQQEQAACAKYTQDNEVFAILIGGDPVMDECAKKAGAVDLGQEGTPTAYQKYPHRIDIDTINKVRAAKVTINGLAQRAYFDQGARIGVVTWDDPEYREAIRDGLLPALKAHGLSLATPPYYIAVPQTLQDFGASSAAINNAVLKFSTLHIDHVMLADGQAGLFKGGGLSIEWMRRSESQQYYPIYGFNDSNLPIELQGLHVMSDRQARGSVYINWTDLGEKYEEGLRPNQEQQSCVKIMREHDIDMSNTNAKAAALLACTDMWFLQRVGVELDALGLSLTTENFITAVERIGYGYHSTTAYANYFSAVRHDGVAGVRHGRFVGSCNCYKWWGGIYKV